MNFLALCRKAALESGTVPGSNSPVSVTGQSGRLLKIVGWVNDAWRTIQTSRRDWHWMRGEFDGVTVATLANYPPTSLGATRHAEWLQTAMVTVQLGSGAPEYPVRWTPWPELRGVYLIGPSRTLAGRPSLWSVNPQGEMVLWPVPDDVYTVRGEYRKAPQDLAANEDVPEMPERFHDLIWLTALGSLANDDENAGQQSGYWAQRATVIRGELMRDQLPPILAGGALA